MTKQNDNIRRSEFSISLKEFAGLLIAIGSLVSAWITLNNSQVETNTKLEAFESYYRESLSEYKQSNEKTTFTKLEAFESYYRESLNEYKQSNEKTTLELKTLISEQKKINKELVEQVNDLERSVTQIYSLSRKK